MYLGDQRRMSGRHRIDRDGVIWLVGHSRVNCTVRDLSRFGATLELHEVVALPKEFDLTFDGASRRYAVVWRKGNRMGVKLKKTGVLDWR
jgi:PilZ domain